MSIETVKKIRNRAMAKTAGDRAKKTKPMDYEKRRQAYRVQNGCELLSAAQVRRLVKALNVIRGLAT